MILAQPVPRAVRAAIGDDLRAGRRQPRWGYRGPRSLPHRMRCVLLATQIAGGIMIIIWTLSTSIPLFVLLKLSGIFRVPLHIEEAGLDESKHGGSAYPQDFTIAAELPTAK